MHENENPQVGVALAGQIIAAAGAALVIGWPVAAVLMPELLANLLPPGIEVAGGTYWTALVVSLVPAALFLAAMLEAIGLFGLLRRGLAFTAALPRSLERLGRWALACAIAGTIAPTLIGLIATANAAEGQKQFIIRIGSGEVAGLVIALLLLAFGRVMRDATRMARENREFV